AVGLPAWSADGRWLAYVRYGADDYPHDLWLVRPDGTGSRRVVHAADSVSSFAWSPAGETLAVVAGATAPIAPVGGSPKSLKVGLTLTSGLAWSPDGRLVAVAGREAGSVADEVWTFASDGSGLRRVTQEGSNDLVGWTSLAPVLPPAPPVPPTERVVDATTVATRSPVALLAADGTHVAFVAKPTPSDCDHVAVWTPGDQALVRFGPLQAPCAFPTHVYELAFAGSRAVWAEMDPD